VARSWTRRRAAAHLGAWLIGAAIFRVALAPAEICPPVTVSQVDEAIDAAATWASTNIDDDGRFLYRYDRVNDTVSRSYNLPRHAGMSTALYQAVVAGHEHYLPAAEASLQYMLDRLLEHDDWVAFATPDRPVKLGSTGLMVAALVHRRQATGDQSLDDVIRQAANFLVQQQEPSGAMPAFWDRETERPTVGVYGAFGTGEAMWGLALAGLALGEEEFVAAARRTAAYVAVHRRIAEGHELRLPDHWAAYAFDTLGGSADADEARYVQLLAADFAVMTRVESTRTNEGLRRYLRWGQALGAGLGALGEGVAGMYRLSDTEPVLLDDRVALAEHLSCIGGMLVERQTTAAEAAAYARPEMVAGAWFRDDVTQVDDQQHTLSALLTIREALIFLESLESGDDQLAAPPASTGWTVTADAAPRRYRP
jgi:hypothetical protein